MERRTALATLLAAGLVPARASMSAPARRASAADPLAGEIVINSMSGLTDPNAPTDTEVAVTTRGVRDSLAGGLTAMVVTASDVTPEKGIDFFEQTVRDLARWRVMFAQRADTLVPVLRASDILEARRQGRLGVILALQNGAPIGTRVDRIGILADLGVRSFQLTYNGRNQLGSGSLVPEDGGLTELGRQAIDRAHTARIMLDLSHSGRRTCLDAARYTNRPVSINHTACAAVTPSPRNKTDEELRLVAGKGGYIGIYTMPYLANGRRITGDDVVAHIEHAVRICGEDHVGIGTDNAMSRIDDMKAHMADYARVVAQRRALGISAPGEDPAIPRFAADLDGPDQFRVIARKLAARGHGSARIAKIMGGNFLRFARETWGA